MKILALGDLHYRDTKPLRRKDDFHDSYQKKMDFIGDLVKDEGIAITLIPGDIFDSVSSTYGLVNKVKADFKRLGSVFGVYGNHDLPNHTFRWNDTPLSMVTDGYLTKASPYPISTFDGVDIYGVSWDEEIPEPIAQDKINILVIHEMIIDEKIWEGQENAKYSKAFLRKHKFDLIVSGDNHKFFTETIKDRHLVNCGSLMRQKINQYSHVPKVVIYDTDTKEIQEVALPVMDPDDVFDLDDFEKEKEKKETDKDWINDLKNMKISEGTDYIKNVQMKANSVKELTKKEVDGIINSQLN